MNDDRDGAGPRTTGRGEARRAAILTTASGLFADKAYDLLSIDEIAATAGMSKGLIYYYFGSKRGLFLAVIEDAADALNTLVGEVDEASPLDRLVRSLDGFLCWAETHRPAFQTVTSGGIGVDSEVATVYARVRERLLTAMSSTLVGTTTPPPRLRIALDGWMSFVEGATTSWLDGDDLDRGEVRDLAVRVLGDLLRAVGAIDSGPDPTGAGAGAGIRTGTAARADSSADRIGAPHARPGPARPGPRDSDT